MGAVAGIIVFLWLLAIGLSGIAAGIVGLIIFGKMRKKGKKVGKPLTIVSAVVLAISIVITIIPVGFFSFIVAVNSTPPDNFVETEIVIAENGYQDTRFTADGVVYEVLPWSVNYAAEDETPTAVFSYKEEGFMNRSQWGNYYLLENEPNFHLVYDEYGSVFCPVSEKEQVIQYYKEGNNLVWYYENWKEETRIPLAGTADTIMNMIHEEGISLLKEKELTISDEEEFEQFEIRALNKEQTMIIASYDMLYINDTLYYICSSEYYGGSTNYTVSEMQGAYAMVLMDAVG